MKKTHLATLIFLLSITSCTISNVHSGIKTNLVAGFKGPLQIQEIRIAAEVLPKFRYDIGNILLEDLKDAFKEQGIEVSKVVFTKSETESIQTLNKKVLYNTTAPVIFKITQTSVGTTHPIYPNISSPISSSFPGRLQEKEFSYFEMEILNKETDFVLWSATAFTAYETMTSSNKDAMQKLSERIIKALKKDLIITP